MLDLIIMGVGCLMLAVVGQRPLAMFAEWVEPEPAPWSPDRLLWVILLLITITSLLHKVPLTAIKGQTLGKMAAGIRVVRVADGSVPGWPRSILRWILPLALLFIPLFGWIMLALSNSLVLWGGRDRQGVHDSVAGMLVVKV